MSRSLVIAPQWIGDAVMSQPLLARLAARGERLTVAALPGVAPVFRAMPEVLDVVALPFQHGKLDLKIRRTIARDWRGRFDSAYVLPNSIKSSLLPWFARIPRRVGYHGEGRWGLLSERLPNPPGRPPMVAFYNALATVGRPQRHEPRPHERPRLVVDAQRVAQAAAKVELQRHRYWVFAPGAEYGPAKRWPVSHYAALARALHQRDQDPAVVEPREHLPIVLLGSAKEASLCDEIAALAPQTCRVLAGQTTLDEAIALIAGSRGMVSNDSGLMHVAAAFGLPQVAVYGSTSPEHTPPHNPRAAVLWLKEELKLECMPCFARECRYGHLRCLHEVPPALAEAALLAQVNEPQPTAELFRGTLPQRL